MEEVDIDNFSEDSFAADVTNEQSTQPTTGEQDLSGGRNKHKNEPIFVKRLGATKDESSDDESVSSEEEEDEDDDAGSESSTIDCLSRDPLFLVLSQFLTSEKKNVNIVDALFKINKSLKRIIKLLKK